VYFYLFQLTSAVAREAGPQGIFELRLKKFHRPAAAGDDKECAGETANNAGGSECQLKFRVCLKHYMAQVDGSNLCTFGEEVLTTPARYNNDSAAAIAVTHLPPVHFAIDFKWPVSQSLQYAYLIKGTGTS
jgi:N terminus of Notch ligand